MLQDDAAADNREFATAVVSRLRDEGYQALWAGGCVRDLVMGNQPSDYDVATSATPQQVRQLFGQRRTLAVGASFGVIIVLPVERCIQPVEVATFRTDGGYSDGRRPDTVVFSTAEEDAKRRDFTVNGMFYCPMERRVIDYVGGLADLDQKVIRAIGAADERIAEDKLRMLRAIRFAARFGFEIEAATWAAVHRHAASLAVVSGERIAAEVEKTLVTQQAAWGVDQWARTGLLSVVLPEIDWPRKHDHIDRILNAIPQLQAAWPTPGCDWRLAMAALLWGAIEASKLEIATADTRQRLRWSNEDYQCIRFALEAQSVLDAAVSLPWSAVQPTLVQSHTATAVRLMAVRSQVDPTTTQAAVDWVRERLQWPAERLNPLPFLDGSDLIQAGFRPGPDFKRILTASRTQQLDGLLGSHEAAHAWLAKQS